MDLVLKLDIVKTTIKPRGTKNWKFPTRWAYISF